MAGNTAKGIFLTVKNKAVFGVNLKASATETGTNVINNLVALHKLCLTAVEIGVAAAVPKMNVGNVKGNFCLVGNDFSKLIFFLVI